MVAENVTDSDNTATHRHPVCNLCGTHSSHRLQWRTRLVAMYEFECQACGKHFEMRILMSAHDQMKQSPPVCPACGNTATRQVVSEFACKTPTG